MNEFFRVLGSEWKKFFSVRKLLIVLAAVAAIAVVNCKLSDDMKNYTSINDEQYVLGATAQERWENSLTFYEYQIQSDGVEARQKEIYRYRMEHRIPLPAYGDSGAENVRRSGYSVYMAVIIVVLLAAAMICREHSQKTVMNLYASPTPRWKIFAAKSAVLAVWCAVISLWLFVCTVLCAVIRFGTGGFEIPQVFLIGDSVVSMNTILFAFLAALFQILALFCAGVLTMLIANLSRSETLTAAIGILVLALIGCVASVGYHMAWSSYPPMAYFNLYAFLWGEQQNLLSNPGVSVAILLGYTVAAAAGNLLLSYRREIK